MASPALPDWLGLDGSGGLPAGTLAGSLDLALPAAGEAHTLEITAETDPEEEDFLERLPAQPGRFNRVFFRPNLFGTGSDRLPWTKWLPPAGMPASSWAALDLSGGTSLWDSFSFRIFIPEGLAGILFIACSGAT